MIGSPYCEYWDKKFLDYCPNPIIVNYKNFHSFKENSTFISRINQFSNISYESFKKHKFLKSFPSLEVFNYYDDKFKQFEFFKQNNIKTPYTEIIHNHNQMQKSALKFPLICKLSHGSSSKNVFMTQKIEDLTYPCLIQEYIPSKFDYRVTVIGDYVFGFKRHNRPNDFRASGSGLIEKISTLPHWELLYNLCKTHKFETMAFDIIDDYIIEMSYTYNADILNYFDYYIIGNTGHKIPVNFDIPYLIINNFLKLKV